MDGEKDFTTLTVAQLREELSQRNLPTGGKKAELLARLQGCEPEESAEAPADEEAMETGENGNEEEAEAESTEIADTEMTAEVEEAGEQEAEGMSEGGDQAAETEENSEENSTEKEAPAQEGGEGEGEEAAEGQEEVEELLVKDECGPDDEEEDHSKDTKKDEDEDKDLEGDAVYKALRDLRKSWYSMIHPPFKVKVADDIKNYRNSQVMHLWPLSVEDTQNEALVAELPKCSHFQTHFSLQDEKLVGRMELVFKDPLDCKKALENLSIEDVNIKGYLSLSEFHESVGEIGKKQESTTVAEHSKLLPWLLYVAPLPEGTTREDLVPIFPDAEEIMVFEKSTQKKGSETEELPGFAYVHYKDIKAAQKAYQEKYFDPAEPITVNEKEVSILAIFDSKNEPWYFVLKPSRRECHMKSLKEGREWLNDKKESDGPEVKRRMFRISQQIRYDYNRLVKDEKARKEFGMPLLEPKVEDVVPDISKESWRPQARHNRDRHWSSRSSRGRGNSNRGGSRSGRGMPRGGGGGFHRYDRSPASSSRSYSENWVDDRRAAGGWGRGGNSGGRGGGRGGYREPGAEHMLRRLSQALSRTLDDSHGGSSGGYRGGRGGGHRGSGGGGHRGGGGGHYSGSHRGGSGGGGGGGGGRSGGYDNYGGYDQRPPKRPRYDDGYNNYYQGGGGGGGGGGGYGNRRW